MRLPFRHAPLECFTYPSDGASGRYLSIPSGASAMEALLGDDAEYRRQRRCPRRLLVGDYLLGGDDDLLVLSGPGLRPDAREDKSFVMEALPGE